MRKTCFETIHKIAKKDKKIIFIGSDLTPGIMGEFKKDLKERFIMEGVSEQHIVVLLLHFVMYLFLVSFYHKIPTSI